MRFLRDVPKFLESDDENSTRSKLNEWVSTFNFLFKNLSLSKNFSSSAIEVELAAGEVKNIPHLLGVRPKYRIILRQEGNGVLSDIPSTWSDTVATIKNNGAETVKATIMFLKE